MNEIDLAWCAGLIDGEGCITISYSDAAYFKGSRNPIHSLYLKVTMTHEPTIRHIHSLFNLGSVQVHLPGKNAKPNWNTAYSWLCCSNQAAQAITMVRPYLITKAFEADIALEFAALPRSKGSSNVIPPEILIARHDCYTRLSQAKPTNKARNIKPLAMAETLPGKEHAGQFKKGQYPPRWKQKRE